MEQRLNNYKKVNYNNINRGKKTNDSYNIIKKKDPLLVKEKLKVQIGSEIEVKYLSLNELFVEVVNKKQKNFSKDK